MAKDVILIKFFSIIGAAFLIFGIVVGFFDLMQNTVLSAILCVILLGIGGFCGILAVWEYLRNLDDELHP